MNLIKQKISIENIVNLNVKTDDKEFMFNLGKLFASGKQIKITNPKIVNKKIEEEKKLGYAKSFNMMIKFWQDNNLKPLINNNPVKNKLFLICPVRNASNEDKEYLNKTITKFESKGYIVHYPARDTNQNPNVNGVNTGGYNICLENAQAMASAKTVALVYNRSSVGSMFDLGVATKLKELDQTRQFILVNDITLDKNNYIDKKVSEILVND